MTRIVVESDGGARGNPGPAAIAAIIRYDGRVEVLSQYIGQTTNNQAEYRAVVLGLKWVLEHLGLKLSLELRLDSELVGRQLTGLYRIKDEKLRALHREAKSLLNRFSETTVTIVRREENRPADRLVNKALDRSARSRS